MQWGAPGRRSRLKLSSKKPSVKFPKKDPEGVSRFVKLVALKCAVFLDPV
jgi:hypothetical protein